MRNLLALFILILSFAGLAQQKGRPKLDLALQQLAKGPAAQNEPIHLLLKGDAGCIRNFVEGHGGRYKYPVGHYSNVMLPVSQLPLLEQEQCITAVVAELSKGFPLLDNAKQNVNAYKVHSGALPLPEAYQGEGVIIGVIDAGIDFQHPDFMNADSTTRIIELWDQNMGYDPVRTPFYGYGQIWDSSDINAGTCPHQDQAAYYGHGTNSAGIAAGNGMSQPELDYEGIAPKSDLIIVSSNFNTFNWALTVADAVDYIFDRASELGRPCVINISLGTYNGSHDGKDGASKIIDNAITAQPGRAVVCAAGNAGGGDPFHLGYDLSADTTFTWFVPKGNPGVGMVYLELWADTGNFEAAHMSIGADKVTPAFSFRGAVPFVKVDSLLSQAINDTIFSESGNMLGQVQGWADTLAGRYRIQFFVSGIDSIAYRFRLMMTGSGRFDLWSAEWIGNNDMISDNLPTASVFPDIVNYAVPDAFQSIVSGWACSDKVITVGNYLNRVSYTDVDNVNRGNPGNSAGALAQSSSWGPSRTGLVKPDVTAPGDWILAPGAAFQLDALLNFPPHRQRVGSGGMHHLAGGTSSASPVVAGIGALFFEKCPGANWADFKAAITNAAVEDAYTGTVPNFQWGHGKAMAFETLLQTNLNPPLYATATQFCNGGSAVMEAPATFAKYLWNNGDTTFHTTAYTSDLYYVQVWDEKGCMGYSDTLAIFNRPVPEKPVISVIGNNPFCPDERVVLKIEQLFGAYEWSTGEHTDSILTEIPGPYACTVKNIYGCTNTSDTLLLEQYPEQPPIFVSNENGLLVSTSDNLDAVSVQWYLNGQPIAGAKGLSTPYQGEGFYRIALTDENGCIRYGEYSHVLSTGGNIQNTFKLHPNPASDFLNIHLPDNKTAAFEIWDYRGVLQSFGVIGNDRKISIAQLSPGVYHLTIALGEKTVRKRFVKI